MGMDSVQPIRDKLQAFRRKYYTNLFIRGMVLTLAIVLGYVLSAALLEYTLWLASGMRLALLLVFLLIWVFCLYVFLSRPLSFWLSRKGLDDEQSARYIASHDSGVSDRLVNLIQLSAQATSDLSRASIEQKAGDLSSVSFTRTIDYKDNIPYLRLLAVPVIILGILWIFNSSLLVESTHRIVNFNQQFSPQAPFKFLVAPDTLRAFRNEDFAINVLLEGESIPDKVFLIEGERRIKLSRSGDVNFFHVFEKLHQPVQFQLEAAGFYSEQYDIQLAGRPELTSFLVRLDYPAYLGRRGEELKNAGNLEVPEGTKITWRLGAQDTDAARLRWGSDEAWNSFQSSDNEVFTISKVVHDPSQYFIELRNRHAGNKEPITYPVEVIKDQYPSLVVNHFSDSILFNRIILGGLAGDDYGLSRLAIRYQVMNDQPSGDEELHTIDLPLSQGSQQSFFHDWSLDSLHLTPGDRVHYYIEVWDNDGVNGRKSVKSASYTFLLPGEEELKADISSARSKTQELLDQSYQKASRLQNRLEEIQQQLKGKQSLDWQDKKLLEDLLREKDDLDKMIEDLQKQNELLKEKAEAFSEQNERLQERAEQIEKLMDQLLDDETRKLLEELEHLLKENTDSQQLQRMLDRLNKNSRNLEKELDRLKELLKKEKFDYGVEQALHELQEMTRQQEELLNKTQDSSGKEDPMQDQNNQSTDSTQQSDNQKLAEEQSELNEEFQKWQQTLEQLEKLSEEIGADQELPQSSDAEEVDQAQQQSEEDLKENKPGSSQQQQKKAIQKMEEMEKQLSSMQSSMSMEMDMQNMESLRQILHGLITLSFSQESLMQNYNQVQLSDPRYNALAQEQLKIQDDARILEDSLLALAKKDPMIEAVVTREVGELNAHAQKALELARERRKSNAASEMQLAMTSMNNLALMLNDHYDMMMEAMANAMPGKTSKKNPGKKPQPGMGEMQRQLNDRIEQLKNGGKSGREMSEELARLAAEQERIRRMFREMEEKMKREGGKLPGDDLPGKMEQTEWDLVNKQITEQTIRRQREILTRLLEAEKSMREQEFDEERKGETAKEYEKEVPRAFEEYLRLKEKEVELLRTMPPRLYPYYKKEVNEYFKRLNQGRQ
jgi:hypothetical protein